MTTYIFPNLLADLMSKVSQRTQMESELLSLTFILFGLIITGVYIIFFVNISLFMKIMTGINVGAGFVFLSSRLVTSFQQYKQLLIVMEVSE